MNPTGGFSYMKAFLLKGKAWETGYKIMSFT